MARISRIFLWDEPPSLNPIRVIPVIRGPTLREIPGPWFFNWLLVRESGETHAKA